MRFRLRHALALVFLLSGGVAGAQDAVHVTSPKEFFGHNIGDDYWLATYDQFADYWRKIDAESDRMQVVEIGKTAEGRPQLMAIISAPENLRQVERYRGIAARLARAEGVSESEAHAPAKEGKAVVWIDGGLHATEVLGSHQLIETSYQLVSRTDAETRRILDDDIILLVHANPDGMQLVSTWYMAEPDPVKRNLNIPRLYQKYVGHDNNRDFYMSNQPETRNVNHALYWDWFPQIVYDHHQTGPTGTVMFAPPFRDPFNYYYDALVPMELDLVAAAMHTRFIAEGKAGVTMRSGSNYSTWWNGGMRTTPYFHNMIGLLTETIGSPTPMKIALVPENQIPHGDLPLPVAPQAWHFRQSIEYSLTSNWAVLDLASRYRETLLFNIWRMGASAIERGSRDAWTITGRDVEHLRDAAAGVDDEDADVAVASGAQGVRASRAGGAAGRGEAQQRGRGSRAVDAALFERVLHAPEARDPRGYVIPADQPDFPTAVKFLNTLRHAGITVERVTRPFTAGGQTYSAGSYVVPTAQAFRPYVLDMFESQDHPNDLAYPGGPPKRPYDNAGWTLALQMGVHFDRLLDGFTCPCERVAGLIEPTPRTIAGASGAAGFILSPAQNDVFRVVNRVLKAGGSVARLNHSLTAHGRTYPAGDFYVTTSGSARTAVESAARELGVSVQGVSAGAPADAKPVRAPRIALWDTYGGSMPSGHTRWLLEQFEYIYKVVYTPELDAGGLRDKYDVIVLVDGSVAGGRRGGFSSRFTPAAEYRAMVGRVTKEHTAPRLREFLDAGGTVVTIGSATSVAYMLDLPVSNALVERSPDGSERVLTADKFYVPGSLLSVAVDSTARVASGSAGHVDVFFNNSPVFRLDPDAIAKGVRPIAWFDTNAPLRSGWAWGQSYLEGGVTMAEAQVGRGTLFLFGPEILFRGQPHGTFRFFFNALID